MAGGGDRPEAARFRFPHARRRPRGAGGVTRAGSKPPAARAQKRPLPAEKGL
jgi:hypothetical protein